MKAATTSRFHSSISIVSFHRSESLVSMSSSSSSIREGALSMASSLGVAPDSARHESEADPYRADGQPSSATPLVASIQVMLKPEVFKAYDSNQCDVLTADVSQLYALRQKLSKPADHVILPDVISKEPLAPVVRQKDDDWLLIVKWTLFAMLNAEELGITSKNIDTALKSKKPDVMRFVGTEGEYGEGLGLTKDWAVRIIRRVGNYGEVYERNVGTGSKLGIPRGLNQLWNAGGILYAPPIR